MYPESTAQKVELLMAGKKTGFYLASMIITMICNDNYRIEKLLIRCANLGACPKIDIFSQIKAFFENKHRHTPSISSIIFKK